MAARDIFCNRRWCGKTLNFRNWCLVKGWWCKGGARLTINNHQIAPWLMWLMRAPPLHHHPFTRHQFLKFKVFPHHLWLQQLYLAAIRKKNWTRMLQPPPHHGSYSRILASELVAKWKHNENLRLAGTFGGRSWQYGGLKSRVWKRNCLMANQ